LKGCALRVLLATAGLLASIGVAFTLLRPSSAGSAPLPLVAFGVGFLAWVAAMTAISAVKAWRERRSVVGGIAGDMPRDGRAMIVGHIEPMGRPLEAPLSGQPCVAFTYEVYTLRGGSKGRSKVVCLDGIGVTPSQIVTHAGTFRLLAVPELDCDDATLDMTIAVARANARQQSLPTPPPRTAGSKPTVEAQWSDDDGEYRRETSHTDDVIDATQHRFVERRIEPGARVCVVGQFSSARRAMVADPGDWSKITRIMKGDPDAIARQLTGNIARRSIAALVCAAAAGWIVAAYLP